MDRVATSVIVIIGVEALLMFAIPIVLLIIWRKKTGARMMPALAGAFTFFLFAYVLENLLHNWVLGSDSALSSAILTQPLYYVLYGCFTAGIFEETGRFLSARFLLRNYNDRESAVTMGIGHGGCEMMLLVGLSLASYLLVALSINAKGLSALTQDMPEEQVTDLYLSLASINSIGAEEAIMAVVERIIAMILHISLSVIVFSSAKGGSPMYMYPAAILLHAVSNVPAAMYQTGVLTSPWLTEALTLILVLPIAYLAYKRYGTMSSDTKRPARDLRDIV